MQSNLEMNLIKLALQKNNNMDIVRAAGNMDVFEYFSDKECRYAERVLVIGASNRRYIENLILTISMDARLIILENDRAVLERGKETLDELEEQLGYKNWDMYFCYWGNLKLNTELLSQYISNSPVSAMEDYHLLQKHIQQQCEEAPLVPDGWADIIYILSFNRFSPELGADVLSQAYTLGGQYGKVLLDILLSDERVTKKVQPLYSGIEICNMPKINEAVDLLLAHRFHGVTYEWRGEIPVKIVDQVEIRPYLIKAYKGNEGISIEKGHGIFYKGPWKEVIDDDGHKLVRGQTMAVSEKTYTVLTSAPYTEEVVGIPPYFMVSEEEATLFDYSIRPIRDPKITKGIKPVDKNENSKVEMEESQCC